ncbi:hypothetical protein F5X68DRAFT_249320 [Plectosphaerella plurivora]|uniref:F-box domain-containing protein n=1 Tax=Plectosphaerella plurivora TaxID=936078 RepID=A0A9P9A628_9PEZI|nr:hypothetical protein F5X68DRAFT_249320 [Plectosphaerella plurivora]
MALGIHRCESAKLPLEENLGSAVCLGGCRGLRPHPSLEAATSIARVLVVRMAQRIFLCFIKASSGTELLFSIIAIFLHHHLPPSVSPGLTSSIMASDPNMASDLIVASTPPEIEPQWLLNRRTNNDNSRLYSLPTEILLDIMELLAIHDRVGIYMIRQSCQRFADLFGASRFRGFHEIDDSIILGREKRNVPLETLPLKAFRERFIDVGFSPYTMKARQVLMRDFEKKSVTAAESDDTDELEPICHSCSRRHPAKDFRLSEINDGKDYARTCERWYGHQNVCSHSDLGKLKKDDDGLVEPKSSEYDHSRDYKMVYWSCEECFGEDLMGTQDDLLKRFPATVFPLLEMEICIDIKSHPEWFHIRWCMPLFANMNDKPNPKGITRDLVRARLWELSEGPYEDLLRLSIGPLASFRDEMFLERFGEGGIQGTDWKEEVKTLETEDGPWNEPEEWPLGWVMENGNLYLGFDHHNWAWTEWYYRDDSGYRRGGDLYWESIAAEEEEQEEEYDHW